MINEKKSIIINPFRSEFLLAEINKEDKKLKHNKVIKK
jgi:hypothetical protein